MSLFLYVLYICSHFQQKYFKTEKKFDLLHVVARVCKCQYQKAPHIEWIESYLAVYLLLHNPRAGILIKDDVTNNLRSQLPSMCINL